MPVDKRVGLPYALPMQKHSSFPLFTTVLFDRDGTLIHDKHYLFDPEGVELTPGADILIQRLLAAHKKLFVVSNQSGIGRGMFTHADVDACNQRMITLLHAGAEPFLDIVYCPHAPEDACLCRKPSVGMWKRIEEKFAPDPQKTLMVGDKIDDLLFAEQAGLGMSALLLTGKGSVTAEKLNIVMPSGKDFLLLSDCHVAGFPNIVARDCLALLQALEALASNIG